MAQNLHMHSLYDDGRDSCREMLLAAQRELDSAGVSLHSALPFSNDWAARPGTEAAFRQELAALQTELAPFPVFTGLEWDVLSERSFEGYDYVIGSVHFLPTREVPLSVDNTPEETARLIEEDFAGDADAAAECYFRELVKVAGVPEAQIAGHFDLITKFQEKAPLFNPESPRYLKAAEAALSALLDAGKVIEVNTGAMARGWRTAPYPQERWLKRIKKAGGQVLLSSDAHRSSHTSYAFREARALLLSCGFTQVQELKRDKEGACRFESVPL